MFVVRKISFFFLFKIYNSSSIIHEVNTKTNKIMISKLETYMNENIYYLVSRLRVFGGQHDIHNNKHLTIIICYRNEIKNKLCIHIVVIYIGLSIMYSKYLHYTFVRISYESQSYGCIQNMTRNNNI